ncbi:alcohol dehydrogenase catalytic domain-containing protein [Curtobacterium sp. MCBD17_035]|uniref:zinc-dependent alcohol dehydrogenase n=1 Tax=Curtobacterium sp. MCBD17_035 TaxID=2175673 RepID=UPI000DA73823|nr:alcohol dehydrogenase catalytic domain-containing protein [Curtobacterium sp. MCBD17_035]WIB67391.1 alcohol dehydrogenase catalytic domain-containing protein [Curtobacterium sp. MCBD17_035]
MKAIVKTTAAPGVEFVEDHPEPTVGPRDVLLHVGAVSICGTDREMYEWTPSAVAFNLDLPVVLGHEVSGTVIEVGSDVSRLAVGDRVALETHIPCEQCFMCRTGNGHNCLNMKIIAMHADGAFAERVAVPENICFPLPEGMPLEVGALLEPAGVAWHALQRADLDVAGHSVLVSGCGPVGLLIVQFALHLGATEVIAVEPNPYRRGWAEKLGATVFEPGPGVVEYVEEHYAHRSGVDVAFEVSAAAAAYPTIFESVRREGTIVTIGHPGTPVPVDIAKYINKNGITLRGTFGRRLWDTWEDLVEVLTRGGVDISWLITHRFPLGDLGPAIDLLTGDANKVLILPNGPVDGAATVGGAETVAATAH